MPGDSVAPQFLRLEGARIRFCSEKQQWRYGRCPVLKLKHLDKCQESQKESSYQTKTAPIAHSGSEVG
ncbi:hypothetical protein F2Q68_00036203 [Brassica cretica]|uniref:Uncharacterized protein n=1 Tax=Brassica cretica TaxID=69181 RepID=A0A8S9H3V2_BRACR|nr:hypothetical protein F2Q68_00036203 [Brassica cretica]